MDINSKLEKEYAALEKLEAKREDLDKAIKKRKSNIAVLEKKIQEQKYNELSAAMEEKGMNFEDVLKMIHEEEAKIPEENDQNLNEQLTDDQATESYPHREDE